MTLPSQRSLASFLALSLTAALWMPTLAGTNAQAKSASPAFTVATPSSLVLM